MPDLNLIVTIDTEEDDWANYSRTASSLNNIRRIPELQRLFDGFGVKPTYLVSYPVATDVKAASIFREFLARGACEVGTHCHPWNTPPFEEEINKDNSMLCNLPVDLQYRKLRSLHEAIGGHFGIRPVSFRAGRWGFDDQVAENIARLGYRIDTSVTSYVDWTAYHGPDFSSRPPSVYSIPVGDGPGDRGNGTLLEVPATIGYLQKNFGRANRLDRLLRREPLRRARLLGFCDRLRILNKVWLSPELSTTRDMIRLTKLFSGNGYRFLNMSFHSSSLVAGLSPFVPSMEEERRFLKKIAVYLSFIRDAGIGSIVLSDVLRMEGEKS